MIIILSNLNLGRCPSILIVKKIRQKDAIKNLKKAAEYGSTF